jgi:hypothetical protein
MAARLPLRWTSRRAVGRTCTRACGRQQQCGAASAHYRCDEPPRRPSACSRRDRAGSQHAPPTPRWPLLLRLSQRHRGRRGVRVQAHWLVDRRGDAALRRARIDRWLSPVPIISLRSITTTASKRLEKSRARRRSCAADCSFQLATIAASFRGRDCERKSLRRTRGIRMASARIPSRASRGRPVSDEASKVGSAGADAGIRSGVLGADVAVPVAGDEPGPFLVREVSAGDRARVVLQGGWVDGPEGSLAVGVDREQELSVWSELAVARGSLFGVEGRAVLLEAGGEPQFQAAFGAAGRREPLPGSVERDAGDWCCGDEHGVADGSAG